MKNYIKQKQLVKEREQEVWREDRNLPVLHKANTLLTPLQEMMVKIIYFSRGMFLVDLKLLFQHQYSLEKIEETAKYLITDGYLLMEKTVFGNLYLLSKEGVSQFRNHPQYGGTAEPFPCANMQFATENLCIQKIRSFLIGEKVFKKQLEGLRNAYAALNLLERNEYARLQFVKQIILRELRKEDINIQKKEYLLIGMEEVKAEQLARAKSYSRILADDFTTHYIQYYDAKKIRSHPKYDTYIKYVINNCLQESNMGTFLWLKDRIDSKEPFGEIRILREWDTNLLKYGGDSIKEQLGRCYPDNKRLEQVILVEYFNDYLRWLQNIRRSILMRKAYKREVNIESHQSDWNQLKEIEEIINLLKEELITLECEMTYQVLKNYDNTGAGKYKDKVLTFRRLKQNGIYITGLENKTIKIGILQMQQDIIPLYILHKKLAMVYSFCLRILPLLKVEATIYTNDKVQRDYIISKLPEVQKKMEQDKETALASAFVDQTQVKEAKTEIMYRYQFFNKIYALTEQESEVQ